MLAKIGVTIGIMATLVGGVGGGILAAEDRYAKKDEIVVAELSLKEQMIELELKRYQNANSYLNDKIEDNTITPAEKKQMYRNDIEIQNLKDKLNRLKKVN